MENTPNMILGKVHRIGKIPIWEGEYTYGLLQPLYYDNTPVYITHTKYVYAFSYEKCLEKIKKMALEEQESLEPESFSFELEGEN